jgi:hypothetical protein
MVDIRINGTDLLLEVKGVDKLLALKSRLTIPLSHVLGITTDTESFDLPKGLKASRASLTGVIRAGTFYSDGDKVFWDVHDLTRSIIIELHDDEFRRLIVQVKDPLETIRMFEAHMA